MSYFKNLEAAFDSARDAQFHTIFWPHPKHFWSLSSTNLARGTLQGYHRDEMQSKSQAIMSQSRAND